MAISRASASAMINSSASTRRKQCPLKLVKEQLSVLYDSFTTKQLKYCINVDMYQGIVLFQLQCRLGDVFVKNGDQ
jgi:hypothetical protein